MKIILLFIILFINGVVYGGGTGTTGFNFLKIPMGVRYIGLGETGTGLADDVNSAFFNPAGINSVKTPAMSFFYNLWHSDISGQTITYAQPIKFAGNPVLGVSMSMWDMGEIQGYGAGGEPSKVLTASDMCGIFTFSWEINSFLDAGLNFKFIQEKLANYSGQNWAVDVGGKIKPDFIDGLNVGVNVQNMGPKIKFLEESGNLPLNFIVGLAYRKNVLGREICGAVDFNFPQDKNSFFNCGLEILPLKILALRAGWKSDKTSAATGLRFGLGIIPSDFFRIDYAFTDFEQLGRSHVMSIDLKIGKVSGEEENETIKTLHKNGIKYYNKKKYLSAILEFNKILKLDPENSEALYWLREAGKANSNIKNQTSK